MNNAYEYANCSLDIDVAKVLIVDLFSGQICKKNEIIKTVEKEHIKRGGSEDIESNCVANALFYMREDEQACNSETHAPGFGNWKVFSDAPPVIGKGKSSVYLFYFEMNKENAKLKGDKNWHCKIGRTVYSDAHARVMQQNKTAMPEQPTMGLVIKTNMPKQLESALHKLLKQFDKHIEDAPGREWFNTCPEEVKFLYEIIIENYK